MDPLDKILSLVLSRTIAAQRAKESQDNKASSAGGTVGVQSTVNNTSRPTMKWRGI